MIKLWRSVMMDKISQRGSADEQVIESMTIFASPLQITNLQPKFKAVEMAKRIALASP